LKKEEGAHLILTAAHPSPFSAYHGFLGCRHFSQINTFLKDQNKPPIKWVSQSA
ncbi:MAG TPA: uracil-DNA glycosylase, partial [Parachlamydiales bacterium]|nr:uracil-DNA glycosylase [Parachlamydiales bacterium]